VQDPTRRHPRPRLGPDTLCRPRHVATFNSRNEGTECSGRQGEDRFPGPTLALHQRRYGTGGDEALGETDAETAHHKHDVGATLEAHVISRRLVVHRSADVRAAALDAVPYTSYISSWIQSNPSIFKL